PSVRAASARPTRRSESLTVGAPPSRRPARRNADAPTPTVSQRERFDPASPVPAAPAMPTLRGESRAPVAHPRGPRPRFAGRLVVWLLVLLVLAFFAAYAMLPALAKERAQRWLASELSRPVVIERLRFDPFTLVADVESLRIGKREGDAALLTVERAHIDFAWTSLRRRGPVIER